MRRVQYDNITEVIGSTLFREPLKKNPGPIIRVTPNTGKQKGKIGTIVENYYGKLVVEIEGKDFKFPYSKVELVDDNGKPVIEPSFDTTGRPVNDGAIVVYSASAGRNSHALEIGKVIKTNPSGTLTVKPFIRDGEPIGENWRGEETIRSAVDASRTLLLPVELSMVTMWILSDFENFRQDSMED